MTHRIDARGLRCPWPAIRLARHLRDAAVHGGAAVELLADDPAAPGEIAAVARQYGMTVEQPSPGQFLVLR